MTIVHLVEPLTEFVSVGEVHYQLIHFGSGPPVILHPSLGRPATDFDELGARLAEAGFHAITVNPPGFGTPLGSPGWGNLDDIASELWAIIDAQGLGPVVLVGHAFGNRVVRAASQARPSDVAAIVLLACGGDVHPGPEVFPTFFNCFNDDIDRKVHAQSVKDVFFAPRNEIGTWDVGWNSALAEAQRAAVAATNFEEFGMGGLAPGLVIQGLDDVIAPPQNAWNLVARRPDMRVVGLPDCGHAILPEQPRAVAESVISFLNERLAR